ncbi:MAG TPA: molybdate ABC transporter substrate-binding protein [Thermoleophilia bacterium]|nr:molybdate ABC transporter substrate-binding protein [Thermoleophilia bacterium]
MTQRRTVPLAIALLALTALVALAGCGSSGSGSSSGSSPGPDKLTVFAAASLNKVFPQIAAAFEATHAGVTFTFNFAGTDTLATQIEQGAPADVFAGASTKYGDELAGKGLIGTPQIFATNKLVLVVPAANPAKITSLADLTRPGVKLVVGDPTVPIGTYTRKVLGNLDTTYGAGYATEVLKNVVSEELDVTSIATSVALSNADAGFVYVTDALSAGDKIRTIELPPAAQAVASYPIAVVKASGSATTAQQFATFVLGDQAQALLKAAGFGPPPP